MQIISECLINHVDAAINFMQFMQLIFLLRNRRLRVQKRAILSWFMAVVLVPGVGTKQ